MRDDAELATSSRTTSPKRRRCSSSSTASSRSSASSETSKSALRDTRNVVHSTISIFGKSSRQEVADHALEREVQTPRLPTARNRGSSSGTFTRAKRSSPDFGSRTKRPRLSESPEMYGKRLPGPDGERRQHRKDLTLEPALQLLELRRLAVLDLRDDDALPRPAPA